eukprot:m.395430 g.395430  ORF g.395430 m.395430 type:complete len:421 (+) comp21100_c0_seq3:414-1676(+)
MPQSTLFNVPKIAPVAEFQAMSSATPPTWQPFGFRRRAVPVHHAPASQASVDLSSTYATFSNVNSAGQVSGSCMGAPPNSAEGAVKEFHCDSCEKSFPHARGMQQHLKTHVQCPQCSFSATQSFLNAHITAAHTTGSKWTYDAADVAKWRAERRKRYPTDSNVQKRKRDDDDRVDRGQTASTPQFRMGKGHYRETKPHTKKNIGGSNPGTAPSCADHGKSKGTAAQGSPPRVDGDGNAYMSTLQSMRTAETNVEATASCATPTEKAGGVGSDDSDVEKPRTRGLVEYSSSDDDDDNDSNAKQQTSAESTITFNAPSATASSRGNDCVAHAGRQESKSVDDDAPTELSSKQSAREGSARSQDDSQFNQIEQGLEDPAKLLRPKKYHNSLLERLLAKEIRRERNTVLQCIRFIVRNNFLDQE